ncbi:MAG TPA: DNA primase [Patescibacteria group bacterium]|jgi:DNA primase|nr:DNA primase [Patescibacteria group bacterium]
MDQVTEIREKLDIVTFIADFLPLKKAGRNFKTNCPFHNEKTPSLVISPERQIWHCFGCGKGGDVYTFLMEYENMEFPEALRSLAKRAGVTLKESSFKQGEYSEKENIFSVNNHALKFYHYVLTELPAGKEALAYLLQKRKINKGIIDTFQLGFAPSSGNALSNYLLKKKSYKNRDLISAGVSLERGSQCYDFFRGRIIFPLFDHRGNVTGFSGRALNDNDQPKYLNTRETAVYHKGSMFFGLNTAKDEIKQKQDAIIVEGEFDAIALYMEGIKNAVAIKGTALTENQVALLSRFTPKVTLCLDQDNAGFEATRRSLEVLEKKGMTTSIIVIKDGKDPDEALKKNPSGFKKALRESLGVYDYLVDKFVAENNKDSAQGKKAIADNLLPLFANISNEIIKEHYLKKLSSIFEISLESLLKEVEKLKKKDLEDKIAIPQKDKRARREVLEEYLIALIVQSSNPQKALEDNQESLTLYQFATPSLGKLLENLKTFLKTSAELNQEKFAKLLSKELVQSFDTCFLFPLPKLEADKYIEEIQKVIKELLTLFIKERVNFITAEIKIKEKNKDHNTEGLRAELSKLITSLPKR